MFSDSDEDDEFTKKESKKVVENKKTVSKVSICV